VVEEVRKEEAQVFFESSQPAYRKAQRLALKAEDAVFNWLWRQYPGRVRFAELRSRIDYIVDLAEGNTQAVDVGYVRDPASINERIRNTFQHFNTLSRTDSYNSFLLVLVTSDEAILFKLNDAVNDFDIDIPNAGITIGRLDGDKFIAVRTAETL
jgi:hypothetical protein